MASLGLVTGGLVTLASVVMVILTSLNIVYTPFDISYFYHGVRRRASKLRDDFTSRQKTNKNSTAQDLSILLSLYYTLLVCGVLAILVTIATTSLNCVAVMSSSSQQTGG